MILNDEVSANAITKRATKHYTVVINTKITNKQSTVYSAERPLANASPTGGRRKLQLKRAEFDTIRKINENQ